jgi:carbonic anhydrase/acetyltransferase-like protein (isoleucine patch superfamily)
MNFYRISSNKTLHSFGDAIGDCPILHKKLSHYQSTYVHAAGGKLVDVASRAEIKDQNPHFIFDENFFFSQPFLKACLNKVKGATANLQFCVERNEFNARYILPREADNDDYQMFDFFYQHSSESAHENCVIAQKVFEHAYNMPRQLIPAGRYHMHQSEVFAGHITSPFHLLFINIAMNLSRTAKIQAKIPAFIKNRFGKYNGKWFYRGLKRMNVIGKNCQIHPTALIEGSIIGDNVIIGANSIVRLSNLADNTYVSDNVTVINAVLGERTFIANSNYVNTIVTYPEVFLIHGPYQISIFGEKSACFAVINCDIRLDEKTIRIPTSEGLIDSAQNFLGIAYGHGSKTGGGNIIAAGRIVPNNLHITPPDNIILNFDDV